MLDFRLDEEQRMLAEAIHRFAKGRLFLNGIHKLVGFISYKTEGAVG